MLAAGFGEAPFHPIQNESKKELYQITVRLPSGQEKTVPRIRDIRRFTSRDFLNWSEPEYIQYELDPTEHLYKKLGHSLLQAPGYHSHVSQTVSSRARLRSRLAQTVSRIRITQRSRLLLRDDSRDNMDLRLRWTLRRSL